MARSPAWTDILAEYLCPALPAGRLRYHPKAGATLLAGVDRGVVYFLASWLPVSACGFRFLTEALAAADPHGDLSVDVVDVWGAAKGLWPATAGPLMWAKYPRFRKYKDFKSDPWGWARRMGGALWVRGGAVQDVSLGDAPDNLRPSVLALAADAEPGAAADRGRV